MNVWVICRYLYAQQNWPTSIIIGPLLEGEWGSWPIYKISRNNTGDATNGTIVPIYNTIDFVICRLSHKSLLTDSRAYAGTLLDSDHRLLIAQLDLSRLYYVWSENTQPPSAKHARYNTEQLASGPLRAQFREAVSESLPEVNPNMSASQKWDLLKGTLKSAAEITIGRSDGYRWLCAKAQRQRVTIEFLCIDLSRAFDTIRRDKLLEVLQSFLDEPALRMIHRRVSRLRLHDWNPTRRQLESCAVYSLPRSSPPRPSFTPSA